MRRSSPCHSTLTHCRGEQDGKQEREDRHMHILVVEDDERLARHLARVLTEERHTAEVQVDAVRIDLTVREFALLEHLLRHPHHALTRAQILTAVWPSDTEVNTTIVDTYVHYLRTKIEGYPGAPVVRTIRSIGYMLTLPPGEDEHPLPERGASAP